MVLGYIKIKILQITKYVLKVTNDTRFVYVSVGLPYCTILANIFVSETHCSMQTCQAMNSSNCNCYFLFKSICSKRYNYNFRSKLLTLYYEIFIEAKDPAFIPSNPRVIFQFHLDINIILNDYFKIIGFGIFFESAVAYSFG